MSKTTSDLLAVVLVGIITFIFAYTLIHAMTLPDVWFSYSTGECVNVLNYKENDMYSCENLPEKFNHVWVQ